MNERVEKYAAGFAAKIAEQMQPGARYSGAEYARAVGLIRGVVSYLTDLTDAERLDEIRDVLEGLDRATAERFGGAR